MLMKGLLLSFLIDIQKHPGLLGYVSSIPKHTYIIILIYMYLSRPHYGPDAVLKDPECSEIIIQLLKGIFISMRIRCTHTHGN